MAFNTDHLVERRQLRRKLSIWRIVAIVSLLVLVVGLGLSVLANSPDLTRQRDHIAKVTFDGVILGEERKLALLKKLEKSEAVKGVIISINSPGGATTGGEAIYEALVELGEKKPVVASMETVAASAGYMIALPTQRIFARRSTITGSIGVIFQYADVTGLMKTIGVEMRAIRSSPLKADPNPFTQRNPEAEAMMALMIDDSYHWFVDLVTKHRPFDREKALELADGRVVTGGQAVELNLVDELGGPDAAKKWLIREHKLSKDLSVIAWKPEPLRENLPFGLATHLVANWLPASIIDLFETGNGIGKLDGLVSVWQAQKSE